MQDLLTPIPGDRWDPEAQLTQDLPARFGSFLADIFLFDSSAFAVSNTEAVLLDPQQRMLLELTQEVMTADTAQQQLPTEQQGMRAATSIGVFVGISTPDYADLAKAHSGISVYSATGSALSVAAGRLSYTFGFKGPSVSVDTACSSSLVGMHMALASMQKGDCPSATASGIKLVLTPYTSAMFNRAGMLSIDGRCKTLDASANGYTRGEAGDAIRSALHSACIEPQAVGALQMHGTGTPLGDPIEFGAATAVLLTKPQGPPTRFPLVFGSGKSSLGHTEPAAGLVGIVHAVHALRHHAALPILHLTQVNAYINPGHNPATFEVALNHPAMAYFDNHCVQGSVVFPGAGYLETAQQWCVVTIA
ncbi:hypothetical protein WJX72_009061 [[Myrmecia] bisecta]|uniref:Ketosynthase family 3 (KS3) domain-containing protein n=1 Tax=[Myrmecia] bisecta TaxID=41462 RepID=A0AAW1Q5Z6_9CHLO